MSLADNSYGSVAEVEASVRHLLDGAAAFGVATVPTLVEVETIIDRVSGVLNTALSAAGFTIPVEDTTSILACNEWVVRWTIIELRNTYPHLGITTEEATNGGDIFQAAIDFVNMYKQAFKNLGETVGDAVSSGLAFTGLDVQSDRSDPDNTNYEQPKFKRGQFNA